jgi:group I intron endonuclease
MKGYIYLITSPLGRTYVGQHKSELFDEDYWSSSKNKEFWNDLQQFGKEKFTRVIICWYQSKKEADELEEIYVEKYNAHISKGGYNLTKGGGNWHGWNKDCHRPHSKEHAKNIAIAEKHSWTQERKEKASKRFKGENNPMFGKVPVNAKKVIIDGIEFNSIAETKRKLPKHANFGHQIDFRGKHYFNLQEAARDLNTTSHLIKREIKTGIPFESNYVTYKGKTFKTVNEAARFYNTSKYLMNKMLAE